MRLGLFAGTLEEFQAPQPGPRLALLKAARRRVVERAERIIIPSRYLAEIAHGWGVPRGAGPGGPQSGPVGQRDHLAGGAPRPARFRVPDVRVRRAPHAAEEPAARGLGPEPGRRRLARGGRRGSLPCPAGPGDRSSRRGRSGHADRRPPAIRSDRLDARRRRIDSHQRLGELPARRRRGHGRRDAGDRHRGWRRAGDRPVGCQRDPGSSARPGRPRRRDGERQRGRRAQDESARRSPAGERALPQGRRLRDDRGRAHTGCSKNSGPGFGR